MKFRVNDLDTGDEWRDFEKAQNAEYDEESAEASSPALPAAPSEKFSNREVANKPGPGRVQVVRAKKQMSEIGVQSGAATDDNSRESSAGDGSGRRGRRPKTARAEDYKTRREPTWDKSSEEQQQQQKHTGGGQITSAKKANAKNALGEASENATRARSRAGGGGANGVGAMVNAEQQTSEAEEEQEDRKEAAEKLMNERKLKRMKRKTKEGKSTVSDDGVLKEIPLKTGSTLQVYIKSTSDFTYF